MTERELSRSLIRAARTFGWHVDFTWSSMHSPKGRPDLFLTKGLRLVVAELKTDTGKVTPEQEEQLAWWRRFALAVDRVTEVAAACATPDADELRVQVHVWRPADLDEAYRVLMS